MSEEERSGADHGGQGSSPFPVRPLRAGPGSTLLICLFYTRAGRAMYHTRRRHRQGKVNLALEATLLTVPPRVKRK
ncbi:hypothetical protein E2C01_015790 [Portunus trituberculatus]|uniref:Uncharacterized protein n=1 Tax=Portunus trituberculatus TaxID=210409 RepID=A0A5B7DPB9_PORTR|nr:hypothetical protein [Portunus trituberculatus]